MYYCRNKKQHANRSSTLIKKNTRNDKSPHNGMDWYSPMISPRYVLLCYTDVIRGSPCCMRVLFVGSSWCWRGREIVRCWMPSIQWISTHIVGNPHVGIAAMIKWEKGWTLLHLPLPWLWRATTSSHRPLLLSVKQLRCHQSCMLVRANKRAA